jgi:hypothetical protein
LDDENRFSFLAWHILTILTAADAVRRESVKTSDMRPGMVGWVESRDSSVSLGVMVHWTSQSKPEQGSPSGYCQAVRDFDVHEFAALHWNSNL